MEFEVILRSEIVKHGGVILNYHMSSLGQLPGRGHFALAVALAQSITEGSSYLLLLDYGPCRTCESLGQS